MAPSTAARCCQGEPRVTTFRVQNLCCEGEVRLVNTSLADLKGIDEVKINLVARSIIVKHCGELCGAPVNTILDKLNAKHLGASVKEGGDEKRSTEVKDSRRVGSIAHVVMTGLLFVAGLVLQLSAEGVPRAHGKGAVKLSAEVLFLASVGLGVMPLLLTAYTALRHGVVDINTLMCVSIAGALALGEWFDASLVVTLFLIAKELESAVKSYFLKAVELSSSNFPSKVTLRGQESKVVSVNDVQIGDIFTVCAGQTIPTDGVVVSGSGAVDESTLTGEAAPIFKTESDSCQVYSGTILQSGYLEVRATAQASDSTFQTIARTVELVQADKGRIGTVVDQFSRYWTPIILFVALVIAVVVPGALGGDVWIPWVSRAIVVLVLACPCALVMAAPFACLCAITVAARNGVLLKGCSVVENLGLVRTIFVDKTGTLTKGSFKCVELLVVGDNEDALMYAASLEAKSAHPLATAVFAAYVPCISEGPGELPAVRSTKILPGIGLEGWVQSKDDGDWVVAAVGNERLLHQHGGKIRVNAQTQKQIDEFMEKWSAASVLLIAVDDQVELLLAVMDQPRPEAAQAIARLNRPKLSGVSLALGCCRGAPREVVMLTGDSEGVAKCVAADVGISTFFARCVPDDKLRHVLDKTGAQKGDEGKTSTRAGLVAMVGDGINDATALSAAHVGIAMGGIGSGIAKRAANMIVMSDNLTRIPASVSLTEHARAVIIENVVIAVAVKLVALCLAIFGYLLLWHAVLVDVGSLLAVLLNSMQVLRSKAFADPMEKVPEGKLSLSHEIHIHHDA